MYETILDVHQLLPHLHDPAWIIVDCRFSLSDAEAGVHAYLENHIPGAVYADLERELSGPPVTDAGRHPLPTPEALTDLFRRLGINHDSQVVAYDDVGGAIAARLWWLLRYMGHSAVALLDGSWQAWVDVGFAMRSGVEQNRRGRFVGQPRTDWLVRINEVAASPFLIDSREPERYRGEQEPIDPVAGHIPGAVNFYYRRNLDEQNRFLPVEQLRRQLVHRLGPFDADEAVFYCGSGVTACLNLLALRHAGLGDGRLYAGSWSEWSRDPARLKATTGR